jgi:predicted RNA-binding Zn-ribbon protein involved in translation (DUF1610 family)
MSNPNHLLKKKVKRLFWDIETSPNVMYSWRAGFKLNLGPHLIIKERKVICICWKWEGESEVHALHWDENQDDKAMLQKFAKVAEEADEMVAHYGDFFDMPWFRTRYIIHGLPPLPAYKTVDTKSWASKYFYFNSNKLDYLGQVLGHGRKLHTEWELWEKVLAHSRQALCYMVKYCKQDVALLEKVWHSLRFCVAPKTHAGVFSGLSKWTCPSCGSKNVIKSKTRVTAQGNLQHQMHCHNPKCGSYYQIPDSVHQDYLEAKKSHVKAS